MGNLSSNYDNLTLGNVTVSLCSSHLHNNTIRNFPLIVSTYHRL